MAKATVTVKQVKDAIKEINDANLGTTIMVGKKAKKDELVNALLAGLEEVSAAGLLDNVPEGAWGTYEIIKPAPEAGGEALPVQPVVKNRKKGSTTAKPVNGNGKPKRTTKAMAFWQVLTTVKTGTRKELAAELHKVHGNAKESEALFWTSGYCAILKEAGVVTEEGGVITLNQ